MLLQCSHQVTNSDTLSLHLKMPREQQPKENQCYFSGAKQGTFSANFAPVQNYLSNLLK